MSEHHLDREEPPPPMPAEFSNESNNEQSSQSPSRCFRWMSNHRLGRVSQWPERFPRSFSLVFGVVLPLFLLIAISLLCGYGLAQLEAPSEIDANNALIANRALIALSGDFHNNVTVCLPTLCLEIFEESKTENLTAELEYAFDELFDAILHSFSSPSASANDTNRVCGTLQEANVESTEQVSRNETLGRLSSFMGQCGYKGLSVANEFLEVVPLYVNDQVIANDISFNWIQCDGENGTGSLNQQLWGRPFANVTRLRPNAQEDSAIAEWKKQLSENYNDLLDGFTVGENGTQSAVGTKIYAFQESLRTANGFTYCYPDSVSGAWFWFTIMTTIGYGTQVPVTQGGQAMVYTLGFLSILLFAVILAGAGTIVVTIVDDFVDRTNLSQINFEWAAMIFWGCCYYAWMLCIAAYTRSWKAERLDVDMEFSEAYWFSFISTTTVGLGDYILEQEVILRKDLFSFPLLFLAGFVLLSNFSVKLTDVLNNLFPSPRKSLKDRLANSNVPWCGKLRTRQRRAKRSKSTRDMANDNVVNSGDIASPQGPHSSPDLEVATGVERSSNEAPMVTATAFSSTAEVSNGWTGAVSGRSTGGGRLCDTQCQTSMYISGESQNS